MLDIIITIVTSVLASSGLWAFLNRKIDCKTAQKEMLAGIGHCEIVFFGMKYIERGWITNDEYDEFHRYLYTPYKKLGGNGSADKILAELNKLPIKPE